MITIASWNIEWLGAPDRRRYAGRGRQQRVDHLAQYMQQSGADVILLQEVAAPWLSVGPDGEPATTPPPVDQRAPEHTFQNPILDAVCDRLNRGKPKPDWRHLVFPARGRSLIHNTAVMWNHAVVKPKDKPHPLFVERWTPMDRPPWAMAFSAGVGKTDFVVVAVHFKSGEADAERAEEANAILAKIEALVDDGDIIVIGDTNTRSTHDPAIRAFADAGFRDLNADERPTTPDGPYGVDRALVPADQPEFAASHQHVLAGARIGRKTLRGEEFRKHLSDHLMIVTQLRVMDDDD